MNAVETHCSAVVLLLDDRWGAIRKRCELETDHGGEHMIVMGATQPLAQLRWSHTCGNIMQAPCSLCAVPAPVDVAL